MKVGINKLDGVIGDMELDTKGATELAERLAAPLGH